MEVKRYSMTAGGGLLATQAPAAIVYLAGSFPKPASAPTAVMDEKNIAFIPHLLAVEVGSRVEFPNRDDVVHSVYSMSAAKTFDLGRIEPGQRPVPTVLFDKPGLVTIRCNIHPNMLAHILVLNTPYIIKTDAQGRYRLTGLPVGHYVLKAWINGKTTLEHPVDLRDKAVLTVNFP